MTTQAAAKKERGEGPISVTYADKAGKSDYKRVPLDVTAVQITPKGSTSGKLYNVAELPVAVKDALAAFALATRAKTYVANHAKPDGSDAINLVDKVWAEFLAGKVYSKGDGGAKVGRKFDGEIYAQAWRAADAAMAKRNLKKKDGSPIKSMTDDQVADLKVSLESMEPKARGERLKSFKSNAFYERALKELQAKSVKPDDETDTDDMPF